MLEFIELKVLLHAKEVKMYFIYMALDFARTQNKELWPRFRKDQNSWKSSRKTFWFIFRCVADYEGTFACMGSFY